MKKSRRLPFLFLTICLLSMTVLSCIKEDEDDCLPEERSIQVYFSFNGNGPTDIDPANVKNILLYVFDKEGYYWSSYHDDQADLTDVNYHMPVSLPADDYQLVAWCNTDQGDYDAGSFEKGKTKLSEAMLSLRRSANNNDTITHTIDYLYFGDLKPIHVAETGNQKFTVPMVQDTYTINLKTEGLDKSAGQYTFVINDRNGSYYFDNSFASDREYHYIQKGSADAAGQPSASIRTLRLKEESTTMLRIYDQTDKKLIFDQDLINLIRQAYSQNSTYAPGSLNFYAVHTYDILLVFDMAKMTVTVSINGWEINKQEEILG
ncbi:FimB/Mfa2 family fimbrial subunit [Dysgonomonas sp. HGC4]|uniref:FimB/Mfa2 family fimbrial subunit n=1 Tax=Dysgonomonas sp. HGC4 TaxID=1658009 RepID=UPI00067FE409|nr:FimB/Mfa2 family fimbrial subunit [Dysgonomonas sp. HGC4]MBD8347789.1 FimB/Mfa2 family fimbrial subunit [Dysgonomonas sp. HGC4]